MRVLYLCAGLEGNGWVVVAEVLEPPLQVVSGNQVSLVQHQHQLLPRLTRDGRLKLGHTGPGRITGVKHFQDDVCSLYHLGKQVGGGGEIGNILQRSRENYIFKYTVESNTKASHSGINSKQNSNYSVFLFYLHHTKVIFLLQ